MNKITIFLLLFVTIILTNNVISDSTVPARLVRFNQLQSYTFTNGSNDIMHYFTQKWSLYNQNFNTGFGQSDELFEFKFKPVVYPNPFEIDDTPRIQFAIPNSFVNNLPVFEVRIYDTRGFEILKKVFDESQLEYKVNRSIQEETFINLEFNKTELHNKLSSGAYLYLILINNEVVAKGKMAVKAYKGGI